MSIKGFIQGFVIVLILFAGFAIAGHLAFWALETFGPFLGLAGMALAFALVAGVWSAWKAGEV